MSLTRPTRTWALAGCLAAATGCVAVDAAHPAAPPRDPEPVVEPPPPPALIAVEDEFRDVGLELELGGKQAQALAHWAPALAPGSDVTERLRAIANLRSGACLLAMHRAEEARRHLTAVLESPSVAPDADFPAPTGGTGSGLREDAERRLRAAGGDAIAVYGAMLRRSGGAAAVALVSLARLGDPEGKRLVEAVAADAAAPDALRELAKAELGSWGSRGR